MKHKISALFSALFVLFSYGQEPNTSQKDSTKQDLIILNEVILSGQIKRDPVFSVVSNKYAKKVVQPKNVTDLFNDLNGFSVVKRGNYAIDPSFRAAQYEQLNVQYDGGTKALHACPNRMDPVTTHIIPEEITKIEIVKGPYTVRYGPTFGGIVNLVTQKPNAFANGFNGKISSGYETNGDNTVNLVQLGYTEDAYDVLGTFGYRDFGNYEDGSAVEIPSSFRSLDYGLKVGYNLSDNERIQAQWRQSFGRDVLHAGLPMDTEYDNSSIASIDYKKSVDNRRIKTITGKVYYSFVDHLMTNKRRPSFMMTEASTPVEATTIGGKFELEWETSEKLTLFSGVDAMHIARDGTRTRLVKAMNGNPLPMPMTFTDKVWQDSYITDLGVFTEANYQLNNSTVFTLGMRYDQVISDIKDPEDDFAALYDLDKRTEHNFSGTLSVKKQVSDNVVLQAAYGRGVRSANMIERFINHFNIGQDPFEYIGNPNLKAEVNNQFEIGFLGKAPLQNGFNALTYEASFYYSFFENYIVGIIDETKTRKFMPMAQPQNPKVFRNLDEAYKTGFELMAKLEFLDDYFFKTELAYVYAQNRDLNESLPLTPPLTTRFSIGFEKPKFWANAVLNIVSQQDEIAPSFGEVVTPGYETLDLRCGATILKDFTLGLAALNVFDVAYNNHLNFSFVNQSGFGRTPITDPGRNLAVFLQYQF
ncbi:TonB-dependent receptor domain-containing protein [uncultured Winogradskyella sp.]|uniref:TonB-dependent receptor domain-containing protein n=1 Tax=uncultured Winogradskyella sp. TaxID=395353 RepID=UPI0035192D31